MIGIYKITSPTGRIYIGQSINIEKRFKRYRILDCKLQCKLYRSFIKHGVENHSFGVLIECDILDLNKYESYYITFFECVENGLNLTYGGANGAQSLESRIKNSQSNKGRKVSEETRLKMSAASKNRFFSEETRKKIGIKSTGRYFSPETRIKMSKSHLGKKMTDEQLVNMRANNPNSKIVVNLLSGIFYKNALEAATAANINKWYFYSMLNGKNNNKTNYAYAN